MSDDTKPAMWRVVVAFMLDMFTSFFVFGFIIATFVGGRTENGFELSGMPAILLFAAVIAYMALMPRYGGRLWQRILKAR